MTEQIETVKKTRLFLLSLISDLTAAQLNEVPPGFNNNIIWNLAHLIATQQGICYARAGLKLQVEEFFFQTYKSGTKPEKFVESSEIEIIKTLLISSLDQTATDYRNNIFFNYNTLTTRYGVALTSIDDAIHFLPFHEGIHTGYILALKRVIKK